MILPVAQLFVVKSFIVLRTRVSQSVVIRMIRLNQDSSRTIATSGTSRDLRDELKRSFRRSEIRQRETDIDRHHADQRHVRKVVTLGQHLRADERIDASGAEVSERLLKNLPPRGCITRSIRATRSAGKSSFSISSSCSVPSPT